MKSSDPDSVADFDASVYAIPSGNVSTASKPKSTFDTAIFGKSEVVCEYCLSISAI